MSKPDQPPVDYTVPKLWRFLFAWLVFVLFMNYDPSGMAAAGKKWLVRVTNYIGAPQYQSRVRDDIVVVLADPTSLDALEKSWPLTYDDQAHVISTIMEHKPRMLALDLLFLDQNRPDDVELLWNTIDEYRQEIPLFGAAAPSNAPSIGIITNTEGEELPFYQAKVTLDSEWPGVGYPLTTKGASRRSDSMAFAMYAALCNESWPWSKDRTSEDIQAEGLCPGRAGFQRTDYEREMLVFWGSGAPDYSEFLGEDSEIAENIFSCTEDAPGIFERAAGLLLRQKHLADADCAFHRVLPLDLLLKADWSTVDAALRNKIVFYGLTHPGIPDIVEPPTTRPLPGVHLHAMALDNLLTYGPDYFGTASKRLWAVGSLKMETVRMILTLCVFAAILGIRLSEPASAESAGQPAARTRQINDFTDLKDAIAQRLHRIGPASIRRDIAAGLEEWRNLRAPRTENRSTYGKDALWRLAVVPLLLTRTATGRVASFIGILLLVFCLDLYVLRVPPVNAFHIATLFLASQVVVPTEVFTPHRRSRTSPP